MRLQLSQYWRHWYVNYHTMQQIIFTEIRAQFTGKPELQPQPPYKKENNIIYLQKFLDFSASFWPYEETDADIDGHGVFYAYAAALLMELRVRIPQRAWMIVSCVCLCCVGSDLWDVMINRSEGSYRVFVPNCARFRDLKTRRPSSIGEQRQKERKKEREREAT